MLKFFTWCIIFIFIQCNFGFNFLYVGLISDDEYVAIHHISLNVHNQSLCVANMGGHALTFNFSNSPIDKAPQVSTLQYSKENMSKFTAYWILHNCIFLFTAVIIG